jgi:hypothetical protein
MSATTTPTTIDEDEEELSEEEKQDAEQQAETAANDAAVEPAVSYPANVERQRQRILRRKVERAIDEKVMQWCCMADDLDFATYGELTELKNAPKGEDFYIYKDNGLDILAVAHLDSVEQKNRFFRVSDDPRVGDIVCSPSLDDRLGAYVVTELLPKLGIKTDILLTVGEERGNSTAEHFKPPEGKQYNWMFEFDRTGTDVVLYQYDTDQRRELLRSVGAQPARGAFSDISYLGHLGCAGFNWGVGYHDYHGPEAWASLHELILQVTRFMRFHERYQTMHMKHDGKAGRWGRWERPSYSFWDGSNYQSTGFEKGRIGASNGARPFRGIESTERRIIPDIDEQLANRKRGSRRGNARARRRERQRIASEDTLVKWYYEGRCPICNVESNIDDAFCLACGWGPDSSTSPDAHVLGMTQAEWERYEHLANVQRELDI